MSDQRLYHRVAINACGTLEQNGNEWPVDVIDLSMQGLRLQVSAGSVNDEILTSPMSITIPMSDDTPSIRAQLQISHVMPVENSGTPKVNIGCKLLAIELESLAVLRRLISLNTGNTSIDEQELSSLLDAIYHKASSASDN